MADEEKQLEIVLPDENQPKDNEKSDPIVEVIGENDQPSMESEDEDGDDVQKQLKKLKKKLEDEQRARKEAEDRALRAQQQAYSAYNEVEDTNLHLVTTAIETVKRDNDILKAQYSEAMSSGEYDRAAELQETMASNVAKLQQLENGKLAMQSRPKVAPPVASDPVEQFASQLSPRSAEWIRKNPQCVTDQRLMQKMVAAHNLAVADGFQPDSDDYFGFIEDTLRLNRRQQRQVEAEEESPLSSASRPVSRQAPPPPAPANRNGSTRPNVVRLTPAEAETAKMLGMTDVEYAKHKVALQKAGRLPN
jgi:hypothetical protein